jgi:predicted RNA-binding Zn-ribbon protein involved in translation (DUF1610 family)
MEEAGHPIGEVDHPRMFQEMDEWFARDVKCREYIWRLRWPTGFVCPNCGMIGEPCEMSQGRLRCRACGLETTLTAALLSFAFSWMAIYLVELFPASVRTTAASFAFSGARLLAWVFPIIAGQIVTRFGGVARAALIMCSVYVIGLIVPWFMPETAGEPLPE